jgi:hypothetical protein
VLHDAAAHDTVNTYPSDLDRLAARRHPHPGAEVDGKVEVQILVGASQ